MITPAGRLRRALLSGSASLTRLGATVAAQILIIPIVSAHLDPERFGLWCTLTSLFVWITLLDFGLPKALINIIAQADGLKSSTLASSAVLTSFLLQGLGLTVLALLVEIGVRSIDLTQILHLSGRIVGGELASCIRLTLYLAIINTQCGLARSTYIGFQLGYKATVWETLGAVIAVPAVVLGVHAHWSLLGLTFASLGPLVLGSICCAAAFFCRDFARLCPSPGNFSPFMTKRLLKLGGIYLVAQMAALVMHQGQPWLLLTAAGASAVGPFTVAQRLISLPSAVLLALVVPLQPAFGEASATGDWPWIRRMFRNTMLGSLVYSALAFAVLLISGHYLTRLLLKQADPVPQAAFFWLCAYMAVNLIGAAASSLLYGLERPRGPALCGTVHATVLLTVGFWATSRYGTVGLAATMFGSMALTNAFPLVLEALASLRGHSTFDQSISLGREALAADQA